MQPKQYLRPCVMAMLAVTVTAGWAQARLCSEMPPIEREFARAFGACRDLAPIIKDAPIIIPVPNVVGLTFDDARARLAGFEVRRSYRASGEPGGTVLAQEPAPPTRAAAGAPITTFIRAAAAGAYRTGPAQCTDKRSADDPGNGGSTQKRGAIEIAVVACQPASLAECRRLYRFGAGHRNRRNSECGGPQRRRCEPIAG